MSSWEWFAKWFGEWFADWFDVPRALWALVLVPVVFVVARAFARARVRRGEDVLGRSAALAKGTRTGASIATPLATSLVVFAAVLGLARPRFGAPRVPLAERGVDLVVCLDASRSMLARDAGASRMDAAREQLAHLLRSGRVGRCALVAFAGEARAVAPVTSDLGAVLELAREVGPDLDLVGGSDLAAALVEAEALLARLAEREGGAFEGDGAAVVLLTDGEDHGGEARAVAERLAADGVACHVLAVGSEHGAKIPLADGTGYLTDAEGRDVVTAVDLGSLVALASAPGSSAASGSVRRVTEPDGDAALELARTELAAVEGRAQDERLRLERPQRFQWFVGASLLALVLFGGRRR